MAGNASLNEFVAKKLKVLERRNLRRRVVTTESESATDVIRDGKKLISFSGNDYLGLTQHPVIKEAAAKAVEKFGVGSGASRLVTGNHPLFDELESKLAKLKGTEDAVVMGSGYLTNIGIIPALIGAQDAVIADELSHACILSGSRLSGASEYIYRHNDLDHLRELLIEHRSDNRNVLIVTDGVFSMDGDLAPIKDLLAVADEFDAWPTALAWSVADGGPASPTASITTCRYRWARFPRQSAAMAGICAPARSSPTSSATVADLSSIPPAWPRRQSPPPSPLSTLSNPILILPPNLCAKRACSPPL